MHVHVCKSILLLIVIVYFAIWDYIICAYVIIDLVGGMVIEQICRYFLKIVSHSLGQRPATCLTFNLCFLNTSSCKWIFVHAWHCFH